MQAQENDSAGEYDIGKYLLDQIARMSDGVRGYLDG